MFREMRRIAVVFCISILFFSCSEKSSQSASGYTDSLIIFKNASDVQYYKQHGQDQISYKIIKRYPAQDIIDELNTRLEAKGWKPLKIDWLNPDIPTSHIRGWGTYIDGTTNPELKVHTWNSDWTNDKEDILTYALSYSYPRDGAPNMIELSVLGLYIPHNLVKKTLKHVKSLNNKNDL